MIYSILEPLLSTKELDRHKTIWTWDTETKDGLRGKELYCWSLASNNSMVSSGFDIQSFFSLLFSLREKAEKTQIVYVHNLGFDARFLIDWMLDHDIKYKDIQVGSNSILLIVPSLKLKFMDSYQFLQESQDEAEKSFCVPSELCKIDCKDLFEKDFSQWSDLDKKRVVDHNKNDVLALQYIMKEFRKIIFEISNVDTLSVNTPASLALKAFRKTMDDGIPNPYVFVTLAKGKKPTYGINREFYEFAKASYFGGRTECFSHNALLHAYYIDRVSQYPTQMFYKDFPSGIPFWVRSDHEIRESLKTKLSIIKAEVIDCPKLKYPILPRLRNGKLCFTNEVRYQGTWCSPEIEYAIQMGYKFQFIEALVYPSRFNPFRPYIETFFDLKSKSKGGKKKGAKLFLNSLYGKFGQRFDQDSQEFEVFESKAEGLKRLVELEDQGIHSVLKCYKSTKFALCYNITSESVKAYQNVALASFVTSYARVDLIKKIHACERRNLEVHYCDTDSLVIERLDWLDMGKELGDWDIEMEMDFFKALSPKVYICKVRDPPKELKAESDGWLIKCKGIDKKNIHKFMKLKDPVKIEESLKKEIVSEERYQTMKASLRLSGTCLSVKTVKKTMELTNTKRQVLKDGSTKAFDSEIESLGSLLEFSQTSKENREEKRIQKRLHVLMDGCSKFDKAKTIQTKRSILLDRIFKICSLKGLDESDFLENKDIDYSLSYDEIIRELFANQKPEKMNL